tara:strand:- start:669 stop:2159 length:1491 start_codon:yes stop_codon:yes gene_type:complete
MPTTKYDFRVLIETEGGQEMSYISNSFSDSTETGVNTSEVVTRINNMLTCSYEDYPSWGENVTGDNTEMGEDPPGDVFGDYITSNKWLSASINGGTESGSILFHHTDTQDQADRLKRYKFYGTKVCNVLGIPAGQWIYPVNFVLDDSGTGENYFSGDISANNVGIANNLSISPLGGVTSNLRFDIGDKDTDLFLQFTSGSGAHQANMALLGYDSEIDKIILRGVDEIETTIGTQGINVDGDIIVDGDIDVRYLKHTGGAEFIIYTTSKNTTNTENMAFYTGDCGWNDPSGDSGNMLIRTGISLAGEGGNITIQTQDANLKNGYIKLEPGTDNTFSSDPFDQYYVYVGSATPTPNLGYMLDVDGDVRANQFYYDTAPGIQSSSDKRLKTNIKLIPNQLEILNKLEPVTFEWNDIKKKKLKDQDRNQDLLDSLEGEFMGLVAQDVELLYPEIVAEQKPDGYKSLDYTSLIVPLIKSVQELSKQVDDLKQEIEEIKGTK